MASYVISCVHLIRPYGSCCVATNFDLVYPFMMLIMHLSKLVSISVMINVDVYMLKFTSTFCVLERIAPLISRALFIIAL